MPNDRNEGAEFQGGVWKAADDIVAPAPRQWRQNCPEMSQTRFSVAAASLAVFAAALITAQALFDVFGRLIGALVRAGSTAFRFQ